MANSGDRLLFRRQSPGLLPHSLPGMGSATTHRPVRIDQSLTQLQYEVLENRADTLARRSQLEILMDIFRAIEEGAEKPTRIMYKANLCWANLQAQLKLLVDGGFLRIIPYGKRRKYELTTKGFNVVTSYRRIVEKLRGNYTPTSAGPYKDRGQSETN